MYVRHHNVQMKSEMCLSCRGVSVCPILSPIEWMMMMMMDKIRECSRVGTEMPLLGYGKYARKSRSRAALLSWRSRLPDLVRRLCMQIYSSAVYMSCSSVVCFFLFRRRQSCCKGTWCRGAQVNSELPLPCNTDRQRCFW